MKIAKEREFIQSITISITGFLIFIFQCLGFLKSALVPLILVLILSLLSVIFIYPLKEKSKSILSKQLIGIWIFFALFLFAISSLLAISIIIYGGIKPLGRKVDVRTDSFQIMLNQKEIYELNTEIEKGAKSVIVSFEVDKDFRIFVLPNYQGTGADTIGSVSKGTVMSAESQTHLKAYLYSDLMDAHRSIVEIRVTPVDKKIMRENTYVAITYDYFYISKFQEVIRCIVKRLL